MRPIYLAFCLVVGTQAATVSLSLPSGDSLSLEMHRIPSSYAKGKPRVRVIGKLPLSSDQVQAWRGPAKDVNFKTTVPLARIRAQVHNDALVVRGFASRSQAEQLGDTPLGESETTAMLGDYDKMVKKPCDRHLAHFPLSPSFCTPTAAQGAISRMKIRMRKKST